MYERSKSRSSNNTLVWCSPKAELFHLFLEWFLRQLTWILQDSYQLRVQGNQASVPAGRGAILRAWLQLCSSAKNAASQQYARCYPRTAMPLSGSAVLGEDALPWGWDSSSEQMQATVCQPLMPPGMWYIWNYHCCLLSERRGVF